MNAVTSPLNSIIEWHYVNLKLSSLYVLSGFMVFFTWGVALCMHLVYFLAYSYEVMFTNIHMFSLTIGSDFRGETREKCECACNHNFNFFKLRLIFYYISLLKIFSYFMLFFMMPYKMCSWGLTLLMCLLSFVF